MGTCVSTSAEVHLLPCIEDPTSMTCTLEVGARDVKQKYSLQWGQWIEFECYMQEGGVRM